MIKRCFSVMLLVGMLQATGEPIPPQLQAGEKKAVAEFFKEFSDAYNSKDINKVKAMSGRSSRRWERWMLGEERLVGVKIVDFTFEDELNVVTRVTVAGGQSKRYSFDAVFKMRKDQGVYSIEDMSTPEADNWNQMFERAIESSAKLIRAINTRDIQGVKETLSWEASTDFLHDLSTRGLLWITETIDASLQISQSSMSISVGPKGNLLGRVSVPCATGGTNIVRQVVFKDAKIDRDEPVEDPVEKAKREFDDWKASVQKRALIPSGSAKPKPSTRR